MNTFIAFVLEMGVERKDIQLILTPGALRGSRWPTCLLAAACGRCQGF